ncbi:hypothetical protein CEP54_016346 [Fusarium duplospermum]|uniref:Uncharacterized protein n=1 Tax=Fusarium duplospermum TaxID=1325734 RepID=A0A428NEQ3_9HYPO|nr:hypothetical protein CEP54_016346 [Fusarium duplospermum]
MSQANAIVRSKLTGLGKDDGKPTNVLIMSLYKAQCIQYQRSLKLKCENGDFLRQLLLFLRTLGLAWFLVFVELGLFSSLSRLRRAISVGAMVMVVWSTTSGTLGSRVGACETQMTSLVATKAKRHLAFTNRVALLVTSETTALLAVSLSVPMTPANVTDKVPGPLLLWAVAYLVSGFAAPETRSLVGAGSLASVACPVCMISALAMSAESIIISGGALEEECDLDIRIESRTNHEDTR